MNTDALEWSFVRSVNAMKYHTMSAPVAWKKSMVLAVPDTDLLFLTVALESSEAVATDEANDIVPDPSVLRKSPALPSAIGILNAVPPDVKIRFVPSDETDSLASCKFHFSTIGMPGRFDLLGTRYYEVLSSGRAVLFALAETPRDVDVYSQAGLVDGVNLITFSDVDDAVQKLLLYKELHNETARLASSAIAWAQKQSWTQRALTILAALRQLK